MQGRDSTEIAVPAAGDRQLTIVTNFKRFPPAWRAAGGLWGVTIPGWSRGQFLAHRSARCLWLVNCDAGLTMQLAVARAFSFGAARLVAVDLVLRAPRTREERLGQPFRRALLRGVDHFMHYFRDVSGYQRHFGIGADRSSFVPFKANLADHFPPRFAPEGEYVLCLGRSMRDFDTFFAAMERLPYPAAIPRPEPGMFRRHQSRFTRPLHELPANVRILDDDGTEASMLRIMKGAKLIVLPVLKSSLVASGISTALNAMWLGKCVIGSIGPGMLDVFTGGEVLAAPPEDEEALARLVQQAWEDPRLRIRTAEAGQAFARKAGGEQHLYQRIIDRLEQWHAGCGLSEAEAGCWEQGRVRGEGTGRNGPPAFQAE